MWSRSPAAEAPWATALRRAAGAAVMLLPLAVFLIFFVGPVLYLFVVSFLVPSQTDLYGTTPTLDNYARLATDSFYWRIVRRTLVAGALITGLSLLIGYPVAFAIARMTPRRRLLCLMLLLFPLMVSNVIRAYGWISILGRRGVVNTTLERAGLIDSPLALLYSMESVVLGLLTILLPFMIISITNSLVAIDRSYGEAAQALGAGPWRSFINVTLPLSTPGIATGMLLTLFLALGAYVTIALLGGPRFKLLVSLVFDTAMTFQWPQAAALAFLLLALALAAGALILAVARPNRVQGYGR